MDVEAQGREGVGAHHAPPAALDVRGRLDLDEVARRADDMHRDDVADVLVAPVIELAEVDARGARVCVEIHRCIDPHEDVARELGLGERDVGDEHGDDAKDSERPHARSVSRRALRVRCCSLLLGNRSVASWTS